MWQERHQKYPQHRDTHTERHTHWHQILSSVHQKYYRWEKWLIYSFLRPLKLSNKLLMTSLKVILTRNSENTELVVVKSGPAPSWAIPLGNTWLCICDNLAILMALCHDSIKEWFIIFLDYQEAADLGELDKQRPCLQRKTSKGKKKKKSSTRGQHHFYNSWKFPLSWSCSHP